jgi:predicted TIM-barrel enzyme
VATTGSGTGRAATIEKVTAMKQAISPQKLALASGVSINNISAFANVADQALVATSVETYPGSGEFNLPKLVELITAAHD